MTVTSAANSPEVGWNNSWVFTSGSGFSVDASNNVTSSNAFFINDFVDLLFFGDDNGFSPELTRGNDIFNNAFASPQITFTLAPDPDPVPGSLPVLGAGGAFCWSRRIRRRLKAGSDGN